MEVVNDVSLSTLQQQDGRCISKRGVGLLVLLVVACVLCFSQAPSFQGTAGEQKSLFLNWLRVRYEFATSSLLEYWADWLKGWRGRDASCKGGTFSSEWKCLEVGLLVLVLVVDGGPRCMLPCYHAWILVERRGDDPYNPYPNIWNGRLTVSKRQMQCNAIQG